MRLNVDRYASGSKYFQQEARLFPRDVDSFMKTDCATEIGEESCPIVVHNNWIVSREAKIFWFKEHLMWLDDSG